MICRECGKNIPEGTFFCPHCGLPVNEAEQAAQADPAGAYQQPAAPVNNYVGQTVAVPQESPVAASVSPAPIMPQAQVDPLYPHQTDVFGKLQLAAVVKRGKLLRGWVEAGHLKRS